MSKGNVAKMVISLSIALGGLLMLFAPILMLGYNSSYGYKWTDTGFSILDFDGPAITSEFGFIGVFSWLQLLSAIAFIVLNIVSIFVKRLRRKVTLWTVITIGITSFFYLIEGIVASIMGSGFGYQGRTLTWVPFILIVSLIIVQIILIIKVEEDIALEQCGSTNNNVSQNKNSGVVQKNNVNTNIQSKEPQAIYDLFGGATKKLRVYDEYVVVEAVRNARSLMTGNFLGGTKEIYYENMLSVQFKPATSIILGYIQFETANTVSKDNFNSENSFTFNGTNVSNDLAREIVAFVKKKIRESKAPKNMVAQAPISVADELLKYKALLDQGVITAEEFEIKKKELL